MRLDLLSRLNAERAARRAAVLVTELASGAQRLVTGDAVAGDPLASVLTAHLLSGRSGSVEVEGRSYFLNVTVPPVRLFVTGAVHISQALAPMARMLGHDVVIVDPRTAFATSDRFPDVALMAEWPDAVLQRQPLDRYTAVIALTHDPKIDDVALTAALRSDCFYVGALGSRKTHTRRVERLLGAGFGEGDIARIHAPIGLPIGAATPAEIALAVLAEVTSALRRSADQMSRNP